MSKVAAELQQIGDEAVARAEWISKPLLPLRIGIGALMVLLIAVVFVALITLNITKMWESFADFVQAVEAGINDIVFIGIAIFFMVTLEARIKRKRMLKARCRCALRFPPMPPPTKRRAFTQPRRKVPTATDWC